MSKLIIEKERLILDGKEFYLASGDMHYFRIFPRGWRRRLQLMKDFGLNTVQTYMPWNLHEPSPNVFNFDGMLDIEAFLSLCDEMGLKVILRCSPFMCSEWDFGGLPAWLLRSDECAVRCMDDEYISAVNRYTKEVCKRIVPYLSTNGGPIILIGIENEYGSFGNDLEYIKYLINLYREHGLDVPFITANAPVDYKLHNGTVRDDVWVGIDGNGSTVNTDINAIKNFQPDKPVYVAEFWDGRRLQWMGGKFLHRDPESVAKLYKGILEKNAFVNFYMFCGGTNFGFNSGALFSNHLFSAPDNNPQRYLPMMTSYDVDAAVSENGVPSEKYFLMRDVLDEYLGREKRPHTMPEYRTQIIDAVKLKSSADFFANIDNITEKCVKSGNTKSMERLGQDYGFIMYSTELRYAGNYKYFLEIEGLHDRADVYIDGEYVGTYQRDFVTEPIEFTVPKDGAKLDILVENMGRINYGRHMMERKGILGPVYLRVQIPEGPFIYNRSMLNNWTIRCIPLKDISRVEYSGDLRNGMPAFYKGSFKAEAGVDTFLDMSAWKKGVVWINGFNLGRYWSIGSQQTLYVPGELLKEENSITVFELYSNPDINELKFTSDHIFSEVDENGWYNSLKRN